MTAPPLKVVLTTSTSLINQFVVSLESSGSSQYASQPPTQSTSHPSPLHLLSAAAASIKSSTTKLSLLTITAPFTPSAIVATLQPLNNSILPSLVTATLLTTPAYYPESFSQECSILTRAVLNDLTRLLLLIKARLENSPPEAEITEKEKQQVTEATGKVWEDCDSLTRFARDDVSGFVTRKAKQWLELMKDAVQELESWDPEEDDVDDQDWLGLDDEAGSDKDDLPEQKQEVNQKGVDENRATISAGLKEQVLKVLSRIPQSVHVIVKQRLEKFPPTKSTSTTEPMVLIRPEHRKTLDLVLKKTRTISDCIDGSAEAMYLGDPELCLKKAGKARALTIHVVEAVAEPWVSQASESKEDQYIRKALAWIQQVDTGYSIASTQKDTSATSSSTDQVKSLK